MRLNEAGRRLLLVAGLLVLTPLAVQAQVKSPSGEGAQDPRGLRDGKITIRNDNFNDMRIYILRAGIQSSRTRIGTVTGHTSANLRIPKNLLEGPWTLQLIAFPLAGSEGVISDPFPPDFADEAVWVLQQFLYLSGRIIQK